MSSSTEASWRELPPLMATSECFYFSEADTFYFSAADTSGPAFPAQIHRSWNRSATTETVMPPASQTGKIRASPHERAYFSGSRTGAPLSFRRSTMNFAGRVWLALRPTVCISFGPS